MGPNVGEEALERSVRKGGATTIQRTASDAANECSPPRSSSSPESISSPKSTEAWTGEGGVRGLFAGVNENAVTNEREKPNKKQHRTAHCAPAVLHARYQATRMNASAQQKSSRQVRTRFQLSNGDASHERSVLTPYKQWLPHELATGPHAALLSLCFPSVLRLLFPFSMCSLFSFTAARLRASFPSPAVF